MAVLLPGRDFDPDEQSLLTVANRLGKSRSWLQGLLTEDRRRKDGPRLQFHHHIGRSPRWTEVEFQRLRAAVIAIASEQHQKRDSSRSDRETDTGISPALYGPKAIAAECDKVLGFLRPKKKETK